MKMSKIVTLTFLGALSCTSYLAAQTDEGAKFGNFTIRSVEKSKDLLGSEFNPSPTVGAAYSITIGSDVESGVDGTSQGFTSVIASRVDAIMDGNPDVIGTDLADVFGNPAANDVVACETLVAQGIDPATGMFRYTLSIVFQATGTALEFDSLVDDFQDPNDIGFDADGDGTITLAEGAGDGITGKGPDGVFFTADDVVAMDGFADTGDGVMDAEFPLLPPFLVLAIDLDGDGDPTNDPPSPAAGLGLFVGGAVGGGLPIVFDDLGTVESVFIGFNDRNGDPADIDGDGIADDLSGLDLLTIQVFADDFNPPLGGSWDGGSGPVIFADEVLCSTNDVTTGEIDQVTFEMTYLSILDVPGFGADCELTDKCPFAPGDIDGNGVVDLLDIGPFVTALLDGEFLCQGDFSGVDGVPDGLLNLLDVQGLVDAILGG